MYALKCVFVFSFFHFHTRTQLNNHTGDTVTLETSTGSVKNASMVSVDSLPGCLVSLERLDELQLNKSNTNRGSDQKHVTPVKTTISTAQPKAKHVERMDIDMNLDERTLVTITVSPSKADKTNDQNDSGYRHMPDLNSDFILGYEPEQLYIPMEEVEQKPCDAYNHNENQFMPGIDMQSDLVEEENLNISDPIRTKTESVYEILDSDEEEAINSRDSRNDTTIDSKHVPTMGVLMMAKK